MPTRRILLAAPLCALLALVLPAAPRAGAAVSGCRADPIVTLSNGVTVQMYTDIADMAGNVTNVAYALHAPKGTSVVSVTYPSDGTGTIPETFTFYADNAVSSYTNTAKVTDATGAVPVTAYSVATNAAGTKSQSQTKSGTAGQTLQMVLVLVQ